MKYEIEKFLKRNCIILLLAIPSMILTIKQMDAEYIFKYNAITNFLFKRIPETNQWYEIVELIKDLGFAYYSGLIFYFVVDYFPTRKRERKEFLVLKDNVTNIATQIDCLFAEMIFFSGLGEKKIDLQIKDLPLLVNLEMSLEEILCNKKITNYRTKDIERESQCEKISSFDTLKESCNLILDEISYINQHICVAQVENELIDILSKLSANRYINNMGYFKREYLETEIDTFVCTCDMFDFIELLKCYKALCCMPIDIYICEITRSTEEDIKAVEKLLEDKKIKELMNKHFT